MKKLVMVGLSVGLFLGFSTAPSTAATKVVYYQNCKELNKQYKGGVARTSSVKNKGGKTYYKPYVSKELYDKNKDKDRDKDFIACER
jgi:hypothetical protein